MAGILLLDRNHDEEGVVHIGADDARHACRLELLPQDAAFEAHRVVRRAGPLRRHVEEDRIVAVVDRLDADDRLLVGGALGADRVIAGPFAERAFEPRLDLGRRHLAFDDDLGMGRDRQPRERALDHLDRPAEHAAGAIELGHAERKFGVGEKEQQRIATERRHHRAGLALFPVTLCDQPALLARALPDAEQVALVHLHPVGAHVDVAGLRIAVDEAVAGADIASAIHAVRLQHRKLEQIDLVVAHDVLHHRAGRDLLGRDRPRVLDALRRVPHDLHPGRVGRQPERDRHAHARGSRYAEHAEAFRIALDLVEHQRRRLIDHLRHGLGQRPDLEVPVGILDHLHFAELLALRKERAQAVIVLLHSALF